MLSLYIFFFWIFAKLITCNLGLVTCYWQSSSQPLPAVANLVIERYHVSYLVIEKFF